MVKIIYNDFFIRHNEIIFYSFLAIMALIMILTVIFVIREVRSNYENK